MKQPTINSAMLEKFEEDILDWMPPKKWAQTLSDITDAYTNYLLQDKQFMGNDDAANQVSYLHTLRDFFNAIEVQP